MTQESIIEKIKKLAAHAASAKKVGSFAEAEVFAEKVNELLIKHKLEMEDVESHEEEDDSIAMELFRFSEHEMDDTRKRCSWQEALAHFVAEYHFCKIMVVPGRNCIWFVGQQQDRACSIYLYAHLVKSIRQICQKQYDKEYNKHYAYGTTSEMIDWKSSFYVGAVHALHIRFAKIREHEKMSDHAAQFALVLTKSEEKLNAFVEENTNGKTQTNQRKPVNGRAYQSGHQAASNLPLTQGIESKKTAGALHV